MERFDLSTYQVLKLFKNNRHKLSFKQYRTICGQALAGDIEGAKKGFDRILRGLVR